MAITLDGTTGITTADIAATTLTVNAGFGSNATAYGCRAWVNFNGTGTVAIRESGNVSSITDNGTGKYTINFTTAMPDANYATAIGGKGIGGTFNIGTTNGTYTTAATQVSSRSGSTLYDTPFMCVAVFR
jgi:hypothetical protein